MIIKFILTLGAFYHLLASLAAMMAVFHFTRVLRGEAEGHPLWRRVFTWGEKHLWISGSILIAAGMAQTGMSEYLDNPKLWTKVGLVLLWGVTSWRIRRTLRTASPRQRNILLGISTGSLLYGCVLGVAKPLAYGVLPLHGFLLGLLLTYALCTYAMSRLLPDKPTLQAAVDAA